MKNNKAASLFPRGACYRKFEAIVREAEPEDDVQESNHVYRGGCHVRNALCHHLVRCDGRSRAGFVRIQYVGFHCAVCHLALCQFCRGNSRSTRQKRRQTAYGKPVRRHLPN